MNKLYFNNLSNDIVVCQGTANCNYLESGFAKLGHPLDIIAQSTDINEIAIQAIFLKVSKSYSC